MAIYNFINYLIALVNRAIYVWGGQGEILTDMENPEAWIRAHETSSYNAERAIKLYRKRVAEGVTEIRAFDCSGLIVYFLLNLVHAIKYDVTAKALYTMCDYHPAITELEKGDLVFYSKDNLPSTISHVGVYIGNGEVIESRGRDYGVVLTKIAERTWNFAGHLPQLDAYVWTETHPVFNAVVHPMNKGDAYKAMQIALNKAGFTDNDGNELAEDSKWGKKSLTAFTKMIKFYNGGDA